MVNDRMGATLQEKQLLDMVCYMVEPGNDLMLSPQHWSVSRAPVFELFLSEFRRPEQAVLTTRG